MSVNTQKTEVVHFQSFAASKVFFKALILSFMCLNFKIQPSTKTKKLTVFECEDNQPADA